MKTKKITEALDVVKKDNQNILLKAIKLRAQQTFNIH